MRPVRRVAVALAVAAVLGAAGGWAWLQWWPRSVPAGQPPLVTVGAGNLDPVRTAFEGGAGEVRVLALFSPT
jgi:hypothetical protein